MLQPLLIDELLAYKRRHVPLKVTTTALRGVDKAGGLDNYLLYMGDRLQSTQASALVYRQHYHVAINCDTQ
jgi:hypothetical protein